MKAACIQTPPFFFFFFFLNVQLKRERFLFFIRKIKEKHESNDFLSESKSDLAAVSKTPVQQPDTFGAGKKVFQHSWRGLIKNDLQRKLGHLMRSLLRPLY